MADINQKIAGKYGLKKRENNLQPGQRVHVPGSLLFVIFEDELRSAFANTQEPDGCRGNK